jgi:phage tail sheath gpL-like
MPSVNLQFNFDGYEEVLEANTTHPKEWIQKLENFVKGVKSGLINANVEQVTDDTALVRASGTVTVASILADDTITINGVTLTGKASPSGQDQFDSDGSNTVVAAAIVTAINAHTSLTGIVSATSSAGVVTVSAYVKGLIGNSITLASSNGTRLAVSAARLAGGTGLGETPVSYSFGKA